MMDATAAMRSKRWWPGCYWSSGCAVVYVESRRFKEGVYERLAARRGLRVLHLEAGDVKNDVFVGKVRAAVGDDDAR